MPTQHGGTATLVSVEPVKEVVLGQTVWEGHIHGFDLDGHPRATRAYAWSNSIDAVRAAIVAEHRAKA